MRASLDISNETITLTFKQLVAIVAFIFFLAGGWLNLKIGQWNIEAEMRFMHGDINVPKGK